VFLALGLALSWWISSRPFQWTASGAALGTLCGWLVTLGAIGLGLRPLTPRPVTRVLVEASYWMYLVHYPVVVALQVLLAKQAGPLALKYLLVVGITFALTCGSFLLFVRRSPLAPYLGVRR
jgi:peptidoglycan/LPS O-acetylase OafA/YrhL